MLDDEAALGLLMRDCYEDKYAGCRYMSIECQGIGALGGPMWMVRGMCHGLLSISTRMHADGLAALQVRFRHIVASLFLCAKYCVTEVYVHAYGLAWECRCKGLKYLNH